MCYEENFGNVMNFILNYIIFVILIRGNINNVQGVKI